MRAGPRARGSRGRDRTVRSRRAGAETGADTGVGTAAGRECGVGHRALSPVGAPEFLHGVFPPAVVPSVVHGAAGSTGWLFGARSAVPRAWCRPPPVLSSATADALTGLGPLSNVPDASATWPARAAPPPAHTLTRLVRGRSRVGVVVPGVRVFRAVPAPSARGAGARCGRPSAAGPTTGPALMCLQSLPLPPLLWPLAPPYVPPACRIPRRVAGSRPCVPRAGRGAFSAGWGCPSVFSARCPSVVSAAATCPPGRALATLFVRPFTHSRGEQLTESRSVYGVWRLFSRRDNPGPGEGVWVSGSAHNGASRDESPLNRRPRPACGSGTSCTGEE